MENTNLTDTTFASLDLHPDLQKGLAEAGFVNCTPIQEITLPLALTGKDVAGQAQTGTGKTIAFMLAAMQKILNEPSDKIPQVVVMAPTRELALQIYEDAKVIGKHTDLKYAYLIGGSSYDKQKKMLDDGAQILVATPGRLIDFLKQKLLDFKGVKVVVLDEADRMFDMGFIQDIRFILNRMPDADKRQSLLFSATLSFKVTELAYSHMNEPEKFVIEPETKIAHGLTEAMYYPANDEKEGLLIGLMRKQKPKKSVVFINTKREGERVWGRLQANGYEAFLLTGDVPQNKRVSLLERFKKEDNVVLVATDVAARGLHIEDVTHVYNYDLPQDKEDYVHRIGRTARAGQTGEAMSFACENYSFSIPDIEDYIGHKIPLQKIAEDDIATDLKPAVRVKRYEGTGGRSGSTGKGGSSHAKKPRTQGSRNHLRKDRGDKKPQDEKKPNQNSDATVQKSNLKSSPKSEDKTYASGRQSNYKGKNFDPNYHENRKKHQDAKQRKPVTEQKKTAKAERPWWKRLFGMK